MLPKQPALARALSDGDDRLVSADEALANLQLRCGGELPGTIAVPALLEAVRKHAAAVLDDGNAVIIRPQPDIQPRHFAARYAAAAPQKAMRQPIQQAGADDFDGFLDRISQGCGLPVPAYRATDCPQPRYVPIQCASGRCAPLQSCANAPAAQQNARRFAD